MSNLNGAYYGPSIPPPPQHKPYSHRSSCFDGCCYNCCCGILSCFCGCIFSIICKILTFIIILIAIAALLFWLIVRPNVVKFHVTDASLTEFNYTNNGNNSAILHYNLSLNVTVRNLNRRVGIYYDYIEVRTIYHDAMFGNVTLIPFFQHHKNTSILSPVLKGQQAVNLGADQVSKLNEMGNEVYEIDVKILMKVRFKLGLFKSGKFKPRVRCDLRVPLKSKNGTSPPPADGFQETACEADYK